MKIMLVLTLVASAAIIVASESCTDLEFPQGCRCVQAGICKALNKDCPTAIGNPTLYEQTCDMLSASFCGGFLHVCGKLEESKKAIIEECSGTCDEEAVSAAYDQACAFYTADRCKPFL